MSDAKESFKGKVAIVTGASSGIGKAVAIEFAKCGAKVVVAARREDRLKGLVGDIKKLGGEAVAIKCDVSKEEDSKKLVDKAVETYGALDIAFLNAGVCAEQGKPIWETDTKVMLKNFDVNFNGVLFGIKAVVPQMIKQGKGGSIIMNSSIVGLRPVQMIENPGISAYAASKYAVTGLMQYLAQEVAPHSIRVNAVAPGAIQTDMTGPGALALAKAMQLFPKLGSTDDVSRAVRFLVESEFITGTTISVCGGAIAK